MNKPLTRISLACIFFALAAITSTVWAEDKPKEKDPCILYGEESSDCKESKGDEPEDDIPSCPDGYLQDGKLCFKEAQPEPECPEGYEQNGSLCFMPEEPEPDPEPCGEGFNRGDDGNCYQDPHDHEQCADPEDHREHQEPDPIVWGPCLNTWQGEACLQMGRFRILMRYRPFFGGWKPLRITMKTKAGAYGAFPAAPEETMSAVSVRDRCGDRGHFELAWALLDDLRYDYSLEVIDEITGESWYYEEFRGEPRSTLLLLNAFPCIP